MTSGRKSKYFDEMEKLDKSLFYVYEHYYNNQCFYVGSGNWQRPFLLRSGKRNKKMV